MRLGAEKTLSNYKTGGMRQECRSQRSSQITWHLRPASWCSVEQDWWYFLVLFPVWGWLFSDRTSLL